MPKCGSHVLITGIPRSGTTLATALIDSVPNAVGLNEPLWQAQWMRRNPASEAEDLARWLTGDFVATRGKLLRGEPLPERRGPDGAAVTNYYRRGGQPGKVENTYEIQSFTRNDLTPDFTLAIKHIGLYLGVLPELARLDFFTIVALVRHPVKVIESWRTLAIPPSHGALPGAAPHWPDMRALTQASMDLLEKQVRMYDLMCGRLLALKDRIALVKYEDLVARPTLLCAAAGVHEPPDSSLVKPSAEQTEDEPFFLAARDLLKRFAPDAQRLYPL